VYKEEKVSLAQNCLFSFEIIATNQHLTVAMLQKPAGSCRRSVATFLRLLCIMTTQNCSSAHQHLQYAKTASETKNNYKL